MDVRKFLKKDNVMAVVGVTTSPEKWGYKIYKTLKESFPMVYAVNPRHERVMGDRCYMNLESLPEKPDVVITVVPPGVTENVVKACRKLGIRSVWMQPGSESKKAIEFCGRNGIECMHGACFVVDALKKRFVV